MYMGRKEAVNQGRAMVFVRSPDTGESATIGVCPACWNIRSRRKTLLLKLKNMGYTVQHKNDALDGRYQSGKHHAPRCPYSHLR